MKKIDIKPLCKEMGLTYKELGEKIGYTESAIKSAIAKDEISKPLEKALQMLLEIEKLKQELKEFENFKVFIKKILD